MAFIINEGIVDCFTRGQDRNERITHCVLGIDKVDGSGKITIHGKAMWLDLLQFVRKRGDLVNLTGDWTTNFAAEKYRQFRSDHKGLWGEVGARKEESCTMFSLNPGIDPVLRFQADSSMACAFVVSSLMIHYRQVIDRQGGVPASAATASGASKWSSVVEATPRNQGSKQTCWNLSPLRSAWRSSTSEPRRHGNLPRRQKARDSSTLGRGPGGPPASSPAHPPVTVMTNDNAIETRAGIFMLNIGRCMRHNLTARQKYEIIFEGKGFTFEKVMDGLLRMSNAKAEEGALAFLETINIRRNARPGHFFNEVNYQLQHGALCARIRLYEGYEKKTMCVLEPNMKFTKNFHFVTIIGVCRTHNDQHGGVMFLAQDSFPSQPFKYISLELLRAMRSTSSLKYIPHDNEIKMPNASVFDTKPEDIVTGGGFQLGKVPRWTDGLISEEEQKELKEKGELWDALVDPYWLPKWARKCQSNDESAHNNVAAVVHADAVEGGHEGVVPADAVDKGEHEASKVADADAVEGEASVEVQCEE